MSNNKDSFLKMLGLRVREIRKFRKLSLRQLAMHCDIDYSDIGKIEKGKRNIQLSTILELSKGLKVHPKELFNFDFDNSGCD